MLDERPFVVFNVRSSRRGLDADGRFRVGQQVKSLQRRKKVVTSGDYLK